MPDNPSFEQVNELAELQNTMSNQGLGPSGLMKRRQQHERNEWFKNTFVPQLRGQGGQPQTGLVDFGGRKIDASVLSQAQALQARFPNLRFSSGYRDAASNRRANGVPNSWHLKGRALDWSGSARDMQEAAAWARQNGAREVLIHNAGSGTHLHTAW